jgi:GDP-L-fucose synthase
MPTDIPKSARIYVAGHRGLVGSAILQRLTREGYTNLLAATRDQLDLRDQAAVNYWFKANRPEYVYLVAGTVGGIWANSNRPAEFIYDNMMIHATVVHAAYLYNVKKLLYLGSSCIYPRECPQPMKEEFLLGGYLEPTNEPYAIAKIAGIKLCQAYRKQYGCNFISAMPTNLYGPNDNFDLESSHVLPALIRKFHLAKLFSQGDRDALRKDGTLFGPLPQDLEQSFGIPDNPLDLAPSALNSSSILQPRSFNDHSVIVWGTGSARREFLHVDDLARACLLIMERWEGPQHINVGAGEDMAIRELVELVRAIIYPEARLTFDHSRPDGTPQKLLDIDKLINLGWNPKINFAEGIKNTYAWYLSQYDKRL